MVRTLVCLALAAMVASSALAQGIIVGLRSGMPVPLDDVRSCVTVWTSQKEQAAAKGSVFPPTQQARLDAWIAELARQTFTSGDALAAEIDAALKFARAEWSRGKTEPVIDAPSYMIGHCMGMERAAPKTAQ